MSPKPSSPFEELDNRILRGYCGAKEFDNPAPLYTKPKTHAEKGEMAKDEQKSPNGLETLPRTILLSASQIPKGENSTPAKAASQSAPGEGQV